MIRDLTQQTFVLMRIRLEDVLVKTNIFVLAIRLQDVFKTFSRHLQDVFKTSSRHTAKTSSKRRQDVLKNVFKISSSCLQDVLKTSSRHLNDFLQIYLQDVFKTYHQVKLFFLTRLWEAFDTFLRRFFSKDGYIQRDMPR